MSYECNRESVGNKEINRYYLYFIALLIIALYLFYFDTVKKYMFSFHVTFAVTISLFGSCKFVVCLPGFNQFCATGLFLDLLKTSESQKYYDVFRVYRQSIF